MFQKRVKHAMMSVGLATLLAMGSWGVASAAAPASAQRYTGQVREVRIDQCGLQPDTCEGSIVLSQPGGQEVALAIPSGTKVQRGERQVSIDELGVGNYVTVQAMALPSETPQIFGIEGQVPHDGTTQVGTSVGERTPTLAESNEP